MTLWNISIENIKKKPLYTFASVLTLALSMMLLVGIQQIKHAFEYQIENNIGNVEMVIGAKGSPLQLVLSSVLHIDHPTGNILYSEAQEISNKPYVKSAVPISYGDNYKGYKIVGTTAEFLTIYNAALEQGAYSNNTMEVVLGNSVAKALNLSIGDTFLSAHGLVENDIHIHHDAFTVVGILKPTQKVIDQLIITPLESIWELHEEEHHDHEDEQHTHEEVDDKEITALLVSFKSPMSLLTFPKKINKTTHLQSALPRYELKKLYKYTGVGMTVVSGIAYIILLVSSIIILISLYKMVKEHAFDLALYRTYGATNFQLIKILSYEAFFIVAIAVMLGCGAAFIGVSFLFDNMIEQPFLIPNLPYMVYLQIIGLVLITTIFAILIAVYPIVKMNISNILSHEK